MGQNRNFSIEQKISAWAPEADIGALISTRPNLSCAADAGDRDNRPASGRGPAGQGGWFDCADHASSSHGPEHAPCQKVLQRLFDSCCSDCAHQVRAKRAPVSVAVVETADVATAQVNVRLTFARVNEQPRCEDRTKNPMASQWNVALQPPEVPLATDDANSRPSEARHTNHERSAAVRLATALSDRERWTAQKQSSKWG